MAKRSAAKSGSLTGDMRLVVLSGKEHFLLTERTRQLTAALEEKHGDVGVFRFDGAAATLADVLDELRSYGLMQGYKLVIVDDADEFMKKGDGEYRRAMERYAAAPVDHATLLLRADVWYAGNFDKSCDAVIKCEELKPDAAAQWCVERANGEYGITMRLEAAVLLVDRLGCGLVRLDTEIAKLGSMVEPGAVITRDLVAQMVGKSREEQGWEIQSAVLSGDPGHALAKTRELLEVSRAPVELLMWSLMDLCRKLHGTSRLLAERTPPFEVKKRMKLWGPGGDAFLDAARAGTPHRFAQLLRQVVERDVKVKTGQLTGERNVEALATLLADRLSGASAVASR
ncbi:MAG: DNA polymerase III subunit delta [Phycisphaeraceae bacterium]|nr:DNA polymerase III subunit delta [Phycisphaerales bacterium]QOJ17659.1 MAG: DNA polymerase III subunit delta [Phycisphaeraceae bacterium]